MVHPSTDFRQDDDVRFYSLFPLRLASADLWGIPWSAVPDSAWRTDIDLDRIGDYEVAYLRFTVSVLEGHPGDGVLFLFNQPGVAVESGLHAHVHVEVIGEAQPGLGGRGSTSVAQVLIGGYNVARDEGREVALAQMRRSTAVRLVGIFKASGVSVEVRCDFLGGFERSQDV